VFAGFTRHGAARIAALGLSRCLRRSSSPARFRRTGARGSDSAPCILVLGDSISAAYGMSLEQGWVALLKARLRERWRREVINASISGDTSGGGLRRLPGLLAEHQPDLLVIELGGNDGLRGYPVSQAARQPDAHGRTRGGCGRRVLILPMEIPPNYGAALHRRVPRSLLLTRRRRAARSSAPFPSPTSPRHPALMQATASTRPPRRSRGSPTTSCPRSRPCWRGTRRETP
jgi:acyl-CoA thioesterase-1